MLGMDTLLKITAFLAALVTLARFLAEVFRLLWHRREGKTVRNLLFEPVSLAR